MYLENVGPSNVANELIKICRMELGEKIEDEKTNFRPNEKRDEQSAEKSESLQRECRPETYMYGFRGDLFPEVLENYAYRKNANADEDTIWGYDVPHILEELYSQIDDGNKMVFIMFVILIVFMLLFSIFHHFSFFYLAP